MTGGADLVFKVNAPTFGGDRNEVAWMRPGSIYLGSLMPLRNLEAARALAARKVSAFATDAIPRTTRAQSMDTLSSMNNIIGYKGVLLAAAELPRYFPMLMTAAGMVPPARVFVIGAAVAGLQAIATARRLGANVFATDVRPEVKEQIESVGAKYVGIELSQDASAGGGYAKELSAEDQQRVKDLLASHVAKSDVVITTAAIPGRKAPVLVTEAMVKSMQPGSVIVDLAAETGGNCEATVAGETTVKYGVTIMGPVNVPASLPFHASQMYSRNMHSLLKLMINKEGKLNLDFEDDIIRDTCITRAAGAPQPEVAGKAS
jgi:NAD(P) transhydrogenase subunit alpha